MYTYYVRVCTHMYGNARMNMLDLTPALSRRPPMLREPSGFLVISTLSLEAIATLNMTVSITALLFFRVSLCENNPLRQYTVECALKIPVV